LAAPTRVRTTVERNRVLILIAAPFRAYNSTNESRTKDQRSHITSDHDQFVDGRIRGAQPSQGSKSDTKKLFGSATSAPRKFGGMGTATAPCETTVRPALLTAF